MKTDKEELRKELNTAFWKSGFDDMFDIIYSKLEAKDKEIAELREYKRLNTIALSGYTPEELHGQITDLKAEIDSVARDSWDRGISEFMKINGCHPDFYDFPTYQPK